MKMILEKVFEEVQNNEEQPLQHVWEKYSSDVQEFIKLPSLADEVISKLNEATQIVCIMSNLKLPKDILLVLSKMYDRGVRVYLLTNHYYSEYESFLSNKAIIRIDSHVSGLMILIDPKSGLNNTNGYLLGYNSLQYQPNETINYLVTLNGKQLKEAFHFFVWKFWDAPEEYRGNQSMEQVARSRAPFDIFPLIEPENFYFNFGDKQYLREKVIHIIESALSSIHIGLSSFEEYIDIFNLLNKKAKNGVKIFIYTDLKSNHSFLNYIESYKNIFVFAAENLTSYFVIRDNEYGLFLSGTLYSSDEIGVEVNSKEVQNFLIMLSKQDFCIWQYHREISLKSIKGKNIIFEQFNNDHKIEEIQDVVQIDHGTIQAKSLREFFEGKIKPNFADKHILARKVVHRWKVVPIFRDSKFKKDPLYDRWEKEVNKGIQFVNQVLSYAETIREEKKSLLGSLIGRFFTTRNSQLEEVVREMKGILEELKNKKMDRKEYLLKIEKVKGYAEVLLKEHNELHEQHEYYLKKKEWAEEKNKLESEIEKVAQELEVLQENMQKVLEEIKTTNPKLEKEKSLLLEQIQITEKKIETFKFDNEEFFEKYNIEKTVLSLCEDLQREIEGYNRLRNKEKKQYYEKKVEKRVIETLTKIGKRDIYDQIMSVCKITDSKEKMTYLKKQLATHSELRYDLSDYSYVLEQLKSLESELAKLEEKRKELDQNYEIENQKYKKELKRLEKEINQHEAKLNTLNKKKQSLGEEFYYTPTNGKIDVPFNLNFQLQLPEEELPKVGILYSNEKKRQLAISSETELETGEEEAVRLKAELVLEI